MARAALITGGAKRVGRELALSLATQGWDIALHYHQSEREAKQLALDIEALGRKVALFPYDLANTQGLKAWFEDIYQQCPDLSLLVNNASVFTRRTFEDTTLDTYEQHLSINTTAPIFLTQSFAKHVKHGHVINLLDADISKTHGSHFSYLLSKKMLAEFTLMAARNLGPHIRVNGICIGVALPSEQNPPDFEENLTQKVPLKQLGNTEDICNAMHYLLAAARVTGQFIYTDSGQHLL